MSEETELLLPLGVEKDNCLVLVLTIAQALHNLSVSAACLQEIAEAQSRVQADRAEEDAYSDEEFAPIVNAAVQTRANEPDEAEAHKRSAEPPTSTRPGKRPRKAKDATAPSS